MRALFGANALQNKFNELLLSKSRIKVQILRIYMKRILFTRAQANNFIPYFVIGSGIAMFSYLTLGTNRAMFTYLTPGTNRIKYYSTKASYSKEMGIIYTNFIKALLHNRLNLNKDRLGKNPEIIDFLEGFQGDKLFTRQHITKLKAQGEFEKVPLTPKSKEFINYVKREFPEFDEFEFVLIKPIKATTPKVRASETKATTIVESVKIEPVKIEPTTPSPRTSLDLGEGIETTPISTTVSGTSKETITENITENITKIVEPVVTETIVKVVEPVAKIVEPVVKIVEPVVKIVENVANIPNIIINNANSANAEATTVTSNTQYASSGLDNLLNLFGLKSIAKILKDIFGFDGDGIIYLLIQLPYLIWFLIAFKDNPEIMKYFTENFGIEEYQAPNSELAPIEYDFAPIDFDYDDSNTIDAASEADLTEEVSRDYANNSDIEYFDYFDYYHSKTDNTPNSKEVVEELKDIGNSLLDSTKDKVNTVVTAIAELEPLASHKDQPKVHVIDDQFSGAIDVFPVAQEVQSMKITSNKTSIGGFFRWLFPMLDFYNLNYHPSYFEKFNLNTRVQPITNKVDYVKMLINELYYTLNLGKFEMPRVNFNLPDFTSSAINGRRIQSHADTLSALEGLNTNTIARRTPNWRNTSLISDNTGFSTYFNKDWNRFGRLASVNSGPPVDILLGNRTSVSEATTRSIPYMPDLKVDTKNNVDNSWIYDSPLPDVNSTPVRPLIYSDYYYDIPGEASNTNALATKLDTKTNALATKLDTKIGIHDLINVKTGLVEVDAKIVKLKDQFLDFHHKINRFDEQIAELGKQKLQFTDKFTKGKLTTSDWDNLENIKKQLTYILDAKASLEASHNLNNDELKSLEIKKSSLLELKNRYEKLLGNIATTPNV